MLFGGLGQGVVFCNKDGKWMPQVTSGDAPSYRCGAGAAVYEDTMYLMCGASRGMNYQDYSNDIHALDLNSWTWTKLNPKGSPPTRCGYLSTWLHNGKIYGFGGEISEDPQECTNQLFCYNISSNGWEWPCTRGKIPSSRSFHSTIICGDTALLFGGAQNTVQDVMNDLHILDMVKMTWTQVHPSLEGKAAEGFPEPRAGHSMTLASSNAAVLFGGYDRDSPCYPFQDCWILNIPKVLKWMFDTPRELLIHGQGSGLWKRCEQHEKDLPPAIASRMLHSAVVEPISKRLWILGGLIKPIPNTTKKVLSMTFNSGASLKFLAMERVARYFGHDHPMLEPPELPWHLKTELKNHFH